MAPLSLGYLAGAGIFLAAFALTLTVRSKVDRFHSLVFWSVILDCAGGATVLTRLLVIGVSRVTCPRSTCGRALPRR